MLYRLFAGHAILCKTCQSARLGRLRYVCESALDSDPVPSECVQEFICNEVQSKKVVIILKLDVLEASVGVQLGDPVEYGKTGGGRSLLSVLH